MHNARKCPHFLLRSILFFCNQCRFSHTTPFKRRAKLTSSTFRCPDYLFSFPHMRLPSHCIRNATGFRAPETIPLKKTFRWKVLTPLLQNASREWDIRKYISGKVLASRRFWSNSTSKQRLMTQRVQNLEILFSIQPGFTLQVLILKTKSPATSKKQRQVPYIRK